MLQWLLSSALMKSIQVAAWVAQRTQHAEAGLAAKFVDRDTYFREGQHLRSSHQANTSGREIIRKPCSHNVTLQDWRKTWRSEVFARWQILKCCEVLCLCAMHAHLFLLNALQFCHVPLLLLDLQLLSLQCSSHFCLSLLLHLQICSHRFTQPQYYS